MLISDAIVYRKMYDVGSCASCWLWRAGGTSIYLYALHLPQKLTLGNDILIIILFASTGLDLKRDRNKPNEPKGCLLIGREGKHVNRENNEN